MAVFISYAREQSETIQIMRDDIAKSHPAVWYDVLLHGGHEWWTDILERIHGCDVFVAAVSVEYQSSSACKAELRYALALNRPVIPVLVAETQTDGLWQEISPIQHVDYRDRTADSVAALLGALSAIPPASALPVPLPPEPPRPGSPLAECIDELDEPRLDETRQLSLVARLIALADVQKKDDPATAQLRAMRTRLDISPRAAHSIDEYLATADRVGWSSWRRLRAAVASVLKILGGGDDQASLPRPFAAGWYFDPRHRLEQRYFDGVRWTEYASTGGVLYTDPPTRRGAVPAWSNGVFAGLMVATVGTLGIAGIFLWLANRAAERRRTQAAWLLVVGVCWLIFCAVSMVVTAIFGPYEEGTTT